MMSGLMPESLNGISACGTIKPHTPFCPCLDENLSPSSGVLVCRIKTLMICESLSVSLIMTLST